MFVETKTMKHVDVRRDDGADLTDREAVRVAAQANPGAWQVYDLDRRNYDHVIVVMHEKEDE
jgi:hypothetical protein